MLIGATMNTEDLPALTPMLAGNNIIRVFPVAATVAGKPVRVLPPWTDTRFEHCRQVTAIPFVSVKVDGDPDAIAYVRKQLLALPDWVTLLYITDRHEPEGDVSPGQFRTNFALFTAMVDALPPALRQRIRVGPVLTRTWTEQPGAGRSYGMYDPGIGDFFGVDMYVPSGTAKSVLSPATLPTPAEFTATFAAYRKDPGDRRDRLWPELGVIGMPDDVDGTARAAFLRGVYGIVKTWTPETVGWKFAGMIYWNAPGKATGKVARIGQRRDFPLNLRTVPAPASAGDVEASVVQLPGDPPAPVAAWNEIFMAENHAPPAPSTPSVGSYEDGWNDGRSQLLKEITALVAGGRA